MTASPDILIRMLIFYPICIRMLKIDIMNVKITLPDTNVDVWSYLNTNMFMIHFMNVIQVGFLIWILMFLDFWYEWINVILSVY